MKSEIEIYTCHHKPSGFLQCDYIKPIEAKFLQSRLSPKIIYYAGDKTSWLYGYVDFFDNHMEYARNPPWQAEIRLIKTEKII